MRALGRLETGLTWFTDRGLRSLQFALVITLTWLGLGCQGKPKSSESPKSVEQAKNVEERPVVFVSNSFLAEVVKTIAGTRVDRLYLLPPNQEPTNWKPNATDLEKMQRARLLVLNGASFEPWVAGVALPSSRMLRTANVFLDQWIETEGVVHSHGPGGEHSHAGIACTTWLDFEFAKLQANAVRERLDQLLPEAADAFKIGVEEFNAQLEQLDQQMWELAIKIGTRPLITSHPFHQYWAKRYGLNVRAVNWDANVSPDSAGLAELQKALQDFPAELFLWDSQPTKSNVELLQGKGIRSVIFSPAANLSEQDSWLDAMKRNLRELAQAIE